jgi:hypothetical protein
MSLFSCVLDFDDELDNLFTISSVARDVVLNVSNIISFHIAGSYHVALDLVIDLETGDNYPISTSEPVFPTEREDFKFTPIKDHEPVEIRSEHLQNRQLQEALNELSLSLQRPHLTQMHCRRALEAVRAHFELDEQLDEKKRESEAWTRLREALDIDRQDIESFREAAVNQRHGRVTDNDWRARKNTLAITFEVIHRFMKHLVR